MFYELEYFFHHSFLLFYATLHIGWKWVNIYSKKEEI
ncbi:hypothetical protein BSNT_09579 [Bacillus subtilis subsp. natto BEST195]|nr:hypothetical protein BSNT_09579 [Bacillus subtilis subsp. natto BEST195]